MEALLSTLLNQLGSSELFTIAASLCLLIAATAILHQKLVTLEKSGLDK